jgi:hypothetical protein
MTWCDVFVSIVIGVATGGASSWYVSRRFYAQGRVDVEDAHRLLELDEVSMRFAALDPLRSESVRGSDGVDDTAHWLDCRAGIMESNSFLEGATLLRAQATRLRDSLSAKQALAGSKTVEHSNDDSMKEKLVYSEEIESMRRSIGRRMTFPGSGSTPP